MLCMCTLALAYTHTFTQYTALLLLNSAIILHILSTVRLTSFHLCQQCSFTDEFQEVQYRTELYEQNIIIIKPVNFPVDILPFNPGSCSNRFYYIILNFSVWSLCTVWCPFCYLCVIVQCFDNHICVLCSCDIRHLFV